MPELTEERRRKHQENLQRMYGGGATDADVGTYLKSYGLSPNDLLAPAPQRTEIAPVKPGMTGADVDVRLGQIGQQIDEGLATKPYIDPNVARVAGGMAGGVLGNLVPGAILLPEELVSMPLGGAVAGEGAKLFNQLTGATPPDTRPLPERLAQTGMETVTDAAGGAAFRAAGPLLKETVRAPARVLRATDAKGALRDFQNLGIPTAGQAGAITGNKATQGVEAVLRKLPTSAAIYQEADEAANAAFRGAGQRIAATSGAVREPVVQGRKIIKGLNTFADKVRAKGRVMFTGIKQSIGKDAQVRTVATDGHVEEIVAPFRQADGTLSPAARSSVPPIIRDVMGELEAGKGTMTWDRMDALRRSVGEQLADPTLINPNSQGQLRRLYRVLSDDMEAVAREKGGNVLRQWTAARRYWSAALDRIELVRDIASKTETEDAFKSVFEGMKDGPTRLRALKKSLPADVWDDLVATKLTQMMEAAPGQQNALGTVSSPASFLTRWNNIDRTARNVLFGKSSSLRADVDRLARVAESIKDTAKERNFSNTGAANFFIRLLTEAPQTVTQAALGAGAGVAAGGVGAVPIAAGAGAALATPYFTAKLLMNPDVVKWLANGAQIATRGTRQGMTIHLARLAAIEANNPGVATDLRLLRRGLEDSMGEP